MCWTNFLAGKLRCELTEYFGAFATTMTSQRISNNSKCCSMCYSLGGLGRARGWELHQSKAHPWLPNLNTKFCSICRRWAGIPKSNYGPSIRPHPIWGGGCYGWPIGSKIVPIEMSSPHSYSTSIHTTGLPCTVWSQYTTWQTDDRQSNRNRPVIL